MNAPPVPVAVGLGALAIGGVVDLVGGDPSLAVVAALGGLLVGVWRVAGALQGGVTHRHELTPESARLVGEHLGTAIGQALARQRQEGHELAAAADRLRRAVRALPQDMQARVAENHHDLIHGMDDTRESLRPWSDGSPPRG